MAKVTSKLQVTLPKVLANEYGIVPGDEIDFQAAGEFIRIVPPRRCTETQLSQAERLRLFDEATARQRRRQETLKLPAQLTTRRDWSREDLYRRGESD